ncbi:MAG TPA: twin transmembrane helix small protein [Candidatus Cybelea sp.]|nr:twin transmembrane helix small protein [Candidatus Cybelea sp.]
MFFWILMAVFMAATLITLLVGVASMGKGGPFNEKYGNKLMRLRVILQGLAIVCFVLGWISG